jgi:copper chaperone NosL
MRRTQTLAVALAFIVSAGCARSGNGPPAIDIDRTACAHCGMLISEPAYAAAYRVPSANSRVFDDIRCLLEAVKRESAPTVRFWFHDAASAVWIDGTDAVFVASSRLRTPMGGSVIAFRDAGAAQRYADQHEGQVMRSLEALLNRM